MTSSDPGQRTKRAACGVVPGRKRHESPVEEPDFREQDARDNGDVGQLETQQCIERELLPLDAQHAS